MLVRALTLQLARGGTLVGALEALVTQKWAAHVVNGQTVMTTAETSGSVTFTFDRAYTPAELAVMPEETVPGSGDDAFGDAVRGVNSAPVT